MSCVKLLLRHGANINTTDEDGDTALHLSLGKHQMVATLAEQLVGVESRPDMTSVSCLEYSRPYDLKIWGSEM